MRRNNISLIFAGLIAIGAFGVVVHLLGGTNPFTPAGYEGYVLYRPLIFGQREFVEAQTGPTSTGWRWRQSVQNIDVRPATHSEQMHIFSSDNLEVSFDVHARIQIRPDTIRAVVEHFSGEGWYDNNVKRPYRTAVREEVRQHDAFAIKDDSERIAETILTRLQSEYADTPFEFLAVSIGNIDYPDSVEASVVANLAAEQRRQRMEVQRQIAEADAQIREVRARGEAEAQRIQQETLTSRYVQHEAADLYNTLADDTDDEDGVSRARVVIVLPTRADRAGVPRVYQGDGR
ncbi:MAG: hypothetical protein GXP55_09280 [Deltaproteobacteria bacterium]|nr:hypothetical protein [Deltaproteobacteria bacterium]